MYVHMLHENYKPGCGRRVNYIMPEGNTEQVLKRTTQSIVPQDVRRFNNLYPTANALAGQRAFDRFFKMELIVRNCGLTCEN